MSDISILEPERLRTRYQLDTFVETGCYRGESLALAYAAGFPKVISCDINPECVTACREKFPLAAILQAESTTMLGSCLPALLPVMGRTLFWLDAHYPAYYGLPESPQTRFPLAEEMRLIREGKPDFANDVIACDDLRVVRDPRNPRWRPGELTGPDAALYVDVTVEELAEPFAATHSVRLLQSAEGVLLLLPKD